MNTRFLKTHCLRAALLLGSLCALTLGANAQSAIAKASVPFEFAAAGAMLPAGEYTLDAVHPSGVLLLHGAAGSVAVLTTFSGVVSDTSTARLKFERRDGVAYLSAVEWPGQSVQVMAVFKRVAKGAVAAALR